MTVREIETQYELIRIQEGYTIRPVVGDVRQFEGESTLADHITFVVTFSELEGRGSGIGATSALFDRS